MEVAVKAVDSKAVSLGRGGKGKGERGNRRERRLSPFRHPKLCCNSLATRSPWEKGERGGKKKRGGEGKWWPERH